MASSEMSHLTDGQEGVVIRNARQEKDDGCSVVRGWVFQRIHPERRRCLNRPNALILAQDFVTVNTPRPLGMP